MNSPHALSTPSATTSTLEDHDCFTVLFRSDLRAYKDNPFFADTPFGRPAAIGVGDAMAREDAAVTEGSQLLEALRACRLELFWCAKQLATKGMRGREGDSVSRALELADKVIAEATA